MINVRFTTDRQDDIQSVELTGHAGAGEYGYDIVCAAVSSQAISVENSLHALLNIDVLTEVDDVEGGYLKITLPTIEDPNVRQDAQLLMSHLRFALEVTAQEYSEFVRVTTI